MSGSITCPQCRTANPEGSVVCGRCLSDLAGADLPTAVEATGVQATAVKAVPAPEKSVGADDLGPSKPRGVSLRRVRGEGGRPVPPPRAELSPPDASPGDAPEPQAEPATASAAWRIRFPWGEEVVRPDEPLLFGRDTPGLDARLASYPNVSRRHARFAVTEEGLVVTDLASTNGTFINDRQVGPGESAVAHHDDVVRLAADLYSTVCRPGVGDAE